MIRERIWVLLQRGRDRVLEEKKPILFIQTVAAVAHSFFLFARNPKATPGSQNCQPSEEK
jgi:hypothetical protein